MHVCVSDEEDECVIRDAQIPDEMVSSRDEMISSGCSLELTTSTSDGLSDKENIVRLLKHHMNSSNRLSNTVHQLLRLITVTKCFDISVPHLHFTSLRYLHGDCRSIRR